VDVYAMLFIALETRVHRCIIKSWFETKLIDYLIYDVVDEILSVKLGLNWETIKKMFVSNHVWCHKHFLDLPPQC